MKLFCSYAFTGEDLSEIKVRMKMVARALSNNGYSPYCDLFDPITMQLSQENKVLDLSKKDFSTIEKSDALIAIITSPKRSIGQIMEIGVAINCGKPVYLFEHQSAHGSSYLHKLSKVSYVYKNDTDLETLLENFHI